MNFENIKEVVRHLKKTLPCKNCKKIYRYKDISVVVATPTEGIFALKCNKCQLTTLAEVAINSYREHQSIVSHKDVDEMHNFLETFNGDFKALFKSSNKK